MELLLTQTYRILLRELIDVAYQLPILQHHQQCFSMVAHMFQLNARSAVPAVKVFDGGASNDHMLSAGFATARLPRLAEARRGPPQ